VQRYSGTSPVSDASGIMNRGMGVRVLPLLPLSFKGIPPEITRRHLFPR
jgi:hypothetical protein